MTDAEFATIMEDTSKTVEGDIGWRDDEDHSPTVEFVMPITSQAGYPLLARGSYNRGAGTLTFAIIHREEGRIYALDMGKRHHNPDCHFVGDKHKHHWTEQFRDKEAYEPSDITAPLTDVSQVWRQFCAEAALRHDGAMLPPPVRQGMIF